MLALCGQSLVGGLVRALERGVDRGGGHLERLGYLFCGEPEHVSKDQDPALPGRDVLQGCDERELDALALLIAGVGGGERVLEFDAPVWVGLDPDGLDERFREWIVWVGRGAVVDREHSVGPSLDRLQAGVGGDRVEPGFERAAAFESGQRSPRAQQRFLERVLGVLHRAEHPIAVGVQPPGGVMRSAG